MCIGGKIAPIFFNTMEDSGALPLEMDVSQLKMGDVIDIYPYEGLVKDNASGDVVTEFELKTDVILDEVRAGGRIPLIIGRGLTGQARDALGMPPADCFRLPTGAGAEPKGWTLAQKMVGKACGVNGVLPGTYCEPKMTTVGSQVCVRVCVCVHRSIDRSISSCAHFIPSCFLSARLPFPLTCPHPPLLRTPPGP